MPSFLIRVKACHFNAGLRFIYLLTTIPSRADTIFHRSQAEPNRDYYI